MGFDGIVYDEKSYKNYIKHLKSVSKDETIEDKKRHIAILNTKQNVIGISMAVIRKTAKQIAKNSGEAFLKLTLENDYQNEFYEDTLIQGLVIAEIKDFQKQTHYFERWVNKIDNWSTCDSVVTSLKKLKKSPEKNQYFEFYKNLCFCEKEFVSRFGLIVLMVCYLEKDYIDEVLEICEKIKSEHYYVKMAVAWLLSMAFVSFKEKVYDVLIRGVLDKFTQNKTISKCRDSFRVSSEDEQKLVRFRIK